MPHPVNDFIIPEKVVTDDKKLEQRIRAAINEWAAGYKIDAFKHLGDEISIEKIFYRPAHPMHLQTQYEKRVKFADHRPYDNQHIPNRTYASLDDVKPWDINLNLPDAFIEQEKSFMIEGSQHVLNCYECKGSGKVTCPSCNGAGKKTCTKCSGSGKQSCHSCGGSGQKDSTESCSSCGGRGQWYNTEYRYDSSVGRSVSHQVHYTCNSCGGSGRRNVRIRCSSCSGTGKETCSNCGGSGKVTCSQCHGSGQITCPTCQGRGRLLHYYAIRQTLTAPVTSQMGVCSEFNEKFAEFVENWESYNCIKTHVVDCEQEMKHPLDEDHILYNLVKDQLAASHKKAPGTRLLFQRLTFYRIDAWSVSYTWKGKPYSMLFHGEDLNIIPAKSPIYDYCESLVEKAVTVYNKGRYTATGWLMAKARHINPYELKSKIADLSETVKATLGKAYRAGALVGAILAGMVAAFALFAYCRDFNHMLDYMAFFNKSGGWLFKYHPTAMGLLALFMAYPGYLTATAIGTEWLERFIPSNVLRVAVGAILGIVMTGVFVGITWLANLIGLTLITTLLLWLAWTALRLIIAFFYLIWKIVTWLWNLIF